LKEKLFFVFLILINIFNFIIETKLLTFDLSIQA